ncbi:MAG: hypothetical protein ACJA0N_001853 [Pseudohongiellaceae bacterium]
MRINFLDVGQVQGNQRDKFALFGVISLALVRVYGNNNENDYQLDLAGGNLHLSGRPK